MENDIIYHYTSVDGLKGILNSSGVKLWMTDTRFLNDKEEIAHGVKLVSLLIQKYHKNNYHDLSEAPSNTEFLARILHEIEERKFYSVSFSSEIEQLSQWLAYCPAQGGYAIGFDKELLKKHIEAIEGNYCIHPVNYFDNLDSLHKKVYSITSNYVSINKSNWTKRDLDIYDLVPEIEQFIATSKQSCFKTENEVRVYTSKLKNQNNYIVEFYNKGSITAPYTPLEVDKDLIKEVVIGPMQHQDLAEIALEEFKKVNNYDFTILKSKIPYRGY
ncbi:hypothetical protein CF123_05395 [Aeromonas veronii]|uniref:DUF2971 domain-containing protein n=1 Tax=Aeromonas veronii TaxID=654 RepID=A0AAX2UVA4_AERVE|nr:DUF2971 domain-containing protein [Aeromonas veronii]TND55340.1 hypothetical protein CF123_05395 [Aeromonas veronii]